VANPKPKKKHLRFWEINKSCHNKKIDDIVIGDSVLSYNELTAKKEFKKVTQIFHREYDDFVLVKLSNGNQIICTPEHPIAVIRGGEPVWISAKELGRDCLLIQYKYSGLNARIICLDKGMQKQRSEVIISKRRGKTLDDIFGIDVADKIRNGVGRAHKGVPVHRTGITFDEFWGTDKAKVIKDKQSKSAIERCKHIPIWSKGLTKETDARVAQCVKRGGETKRKRCREDPQFVIKQLKNFRLYDRPNKAEGNLLELLKSIVPDEFGYNGGGQLGVAIGGMIPDFWNINGKKKVIEYFGSYWHNPKGEWGRIARYRELGVDCLVIWDYEMQNIEAVKNKILTFTHNPNVELVKVVSVEQYKTKPQIVYNLEVEGNNNYFAYGILVHNCWRQGVKWVVLPPRNDGTYHTEDILYLDRAPPGVYRFATGKGSSYKTLQIIGGAPRHDADVDMGWAQVHISAKGKDLTMNFAGGQEAAENRWAEVEKMEELERASYAEPPQGEIIQRIPKAKGVDYQRLYRELKTKANESGISVKDVPYEILKDYAAMNPSFADQIGYKMPDNEIQLNREWNTSAKDRYENLRHELAEMRSMGKGEDYWVAHNEALEVEDETTKLPMPKRAKVEKVEKQPEIPSKFYLGRRLRPANLQITV
jgi:hypothetical protein